MTGDNLKLLSQELLVEGRAWRDSSRAFYAFRYYAEGMKDEENPISRRGFLSKTGLAAMALALGAKIPFGEYMPEGLIPAAFAATNEDFALKGKNGLVVLNDRPLNAETPPHLLDDEMTPIERMYVRNNGLIPEIAKTGNAKGWTLTIDGEVKKTLVLTLDDLKSKFRNYTYQLWLECGGNGRKGYSPPTPGAPVDIRRSRMPALDRGSLEGCSERGGAEAHRSIHRVLRP